VVFDTLWPSCGHMATFRTTARRPNSRVDPKAFPIFFTLHEPIHLRDNAKIPGQHNRSCEDEQVMIRLSSKNDEGGVGYKTGERERNGAIA